MGLLRWTKTKEEEFGINQARGNPSTKGHTKALEEEGKRRSFGLVCYDLFGKGISVVASDLLFSRQSLLVCICLEESLFFSYRVSICP